MKRKILTALLAVVAVICLAFGLSACAKTAEPKQEGLTVSTAYTMAAELGYNGTDDEFVTTVAGNEEVIIANVYTNENGEIIVLFSDGSTLNLGTASHSHRYGSWQITVAPTCTSAGYYTRACSVCGDLDYKFIEATGHNPNYITHSQSLHIYECKTCGEIVSGEHEFDENEVCGFCNYKADYTLKLLYTINDDYSSYSVRKGNNYMDYENVVIPSEYRGLPVTAISINGFGNCLNMKSIVIPDSVTEFGKFTFANCQQLTDITLPDNLKKIDDWAFYRCYALEKVDLPESVTEAGKYIFRNCTQIKEINLPKSWTSVPYGMFYGCTGIETFELPENITAIGNSAFAYCAFTSVTIPETVTTIDLNAFAYCKELETVVLSDKLTEIGASAFACCESLTETELPDSLEYLGNFAFKNCTSLTKISLPASNTEYGTDVFSNCTALESVTLNEGFTKITKGLFSGCENLTELVIPSSINLIEASALLNTTALTKITYNGAMAEWKAIEKESGWKTSDNNMAGLTIKCTDGVLEYIW